jgi:hypothetical protein
MTVSVHDIIVIGTLSMFVILSVRKENCKNPPISFSVYLSVVPKPSSFEVEIAIV